MLASGMLDWACGLMRCDAVVVSRGWNGRCRQRVGAREDGRGGGEGV